MKRTILLCLLAAAFSACADRDARLRGTLTDDWTDAPLFVALEGAPGRVEIRNDSFAIGSVPAGPVRLWFLSGEERIARMDLENLRAGATLSLERIRPGEAGELAFPSTVRIEGADRVTINGIRMTDPEEVSPRIDEEGIVLAASSGGDALLVRPRDEGLPDLPVVVVPSTRVEDLSGAVVPLERVEAGQPVRVEGRTAAGYLFAERIRVDDRQAAGSPVRTPGDGIRSAERGDRERGSGGERDEDRGGRGQGREQRASEPPRGQIPEGHRPPPGECRDWIPNLPPGQQPPPRKC